MHRLTQNFSPKERISALADGLALTWEAGSSAAAKGDIATLDWIKANEPKALYWADPDNGWNFAFSAAAHGQTEVLDWIKENAPGILDAIDKDVGDNISHIAALNGQIPVIDWIAEHKPELFYEPNQTGSTPAHCAALEDESSVLNRLNELAPELFDLIDNYGDNFAHHAGLEAYAWAKGNKPEALKKVNDDNEVPLYTFAAHHSFKDTLWLVRHVQFEKVSPVVTLPLAFGIIAVIKSFNAITGAISNVAKSAIEGLIPKAEAAPRI